MDETNKRRVHNLSAMYDVRALPESQRQLRLASVDPVRALQAFVEFAQAPDVTTDALYPVLKHLRGRGATAGSGAGETLEFIRESARGLWQVVVAEATIRAVQAEALAVLRSVIGEDAYEGDPIAFIPYVSRAPGVSGPIRRSFVSIRDFLLFGIIEFLQAVGADRLHVCPALAPRGRGVCGRIFVRVKRKTYCSTRCQMRALMQRERAHDKREQQRAAKGGRRGKATRKR